MKILALSDTHLGHTSWNGFGERAWAEAERLSRETQIDVLLFCGDLCEPGCTSLSEGLKLMSRVVATKKLWVAGNNDIETAYRYMGGSVFNYANWLATEAFPHGVHVLDYGPVQWGSYTFVGGFGFYDLSLWRAPSVRSPNFPHSLEVIRRDADDFHRKDMGTTVAELFSFCQDQIQRHLRAVSPESKVIVATHTIPDAGMVLYGHSPAFDFQNAWMGWDDSNMPHPIALTPNLALQFCGHTHRSKRIDRPGTAPLVNVSGQDQPFVYDL